MTKTFRFLLIAGALFLGCMAYVIAIAGTSAPTKAAVSSETIEIVDVRGRTVTIPRRVGKISIDDGRFLVALSLLLPNPVKPLAAWPHDINRLGKKTYALLKRKFPAIEALPQIASSAETFNMEALLAAEPDVAVFSLGHGPSGSQIELLKSVGIEVVFIDFALHPFDNQAQSLRILGKLTGSLDEAKRYIAFRQEHLSRIRRKVADLPLSSQPAVFLEAHAGISNDCCYSPGDGSIGAYIDFVGGHNIGADVIPGASGKLSIEYILSRNPDVYIATGGPQLAKTGGLVLGRGYSTAEARQSLRGITQRQGIAHMGAIQRGDVYGLSHQLLKSPLDIVAIEALAKWIHPELFEGISPAQTLETINQEFLAVPYKKGTFRVDLQEKTSPADKHNTEKPATATDSG